MLYCPWVISWEHLCFSLHKNIPHNVMHIKQALEWRCSGALGPGSSISQNVSAAWLWEQGLASKLLHQMANFTNGPRWETSLGGAHPARVGSALCFPAGSQCWLTAAGAGLARGLPKSGKPRGGSALWWSTAALLFPCWASTLGEHRPSDNTSHKMADHGAAWGRPAWATCLG